MAERLALIIANSDFTDPKLCRLKTPIRDAKALAEVLGDPEIGDFDVALLIDKPEPLVRRRIARLYYRRKRSDLLLLYYSGHGIRDAHGDLYLATRDTEMDIAGATALDAAYVRKQIGDIWSRCAIWMVVWEFVIFCSQLQQRVSEVVGSVEDYKICEGVQ